MGVRLLPGGALRDLIVRVSLFDHKFRAEDQKKAQSCLLLVFFVLERTFTHAWEAQAIFWGTQALKYTPAALGLLLFFVVQPSLGWHNSRLGGTSSDSGGETAPEMPFHGAGSETGEAALTALLQPVEWIDDCPHSFSA